MRQIFKYVFILSISFFTMQSCVDKDFDDIDKGGVIPIPPLKLKVDPVELGALDELPDISIPPELGTEFEASVAISDTIKGIFSEDAVKDFFYEGAKMVEIEFVIDNENSKIMLSNATIDIHFTVLKSPEANNTKPISLPKERIELDGQGKFKKDTFVLSFSDIINEMDGANDLEIKVIASVTHKSSIHFESDDILVFKWLTFRTSGMYFEF